MQAVYKSGGNSRKADEQGDLKLDQPSVVSLKIAPESVTRYERRGDDLVLVLRDGKEVAVRGFFLAYEGDGRNDLVLEDANGVLWWGQYTGPWHEFHFTEIEWSDAAPLWLPPWLLAGLGVLGLAAAGGGGGGSSGGGGFIPMLPPAANRPPEAPDHKHTIAEDGSASGRIGGTDPDGDPLNYQMVTPPSHGTVVIHPDGSYTYTPDPDYNGPDQFVVTVDDGKGGTTTSTVDIVVTPENDAPVPADTLPDQTGEDAQGGVNVPTAGAFTDVDGDALTYTATGLPPGLTIDPVTGVISGTIDPSASTGGPYTVTVTATDPDGESAEQTFTWTVGNPPPVANDDEATTAEDTPVSGNVLTGAGTDDVADSDPDGDTLTVTQFEVDGTTYPVVPGTPGVAVIAGVGTLELGSDGAYTFTPDANWNGTVPTVTYTISDGEGGTDTAELTITVSPVTDLTAADDSNSTDEDTPVSGTVATNDSTISGGTLTFAKETDPSNGTVVVNPDGTYTYTPNANFNGTDSFTYTVTDADSGESLTQTVTITVNPVTDLTAADDSNSTDEDTPVSGTVATNDSTISGGTLTFAKETDPSNGTVVVNPDGTYTYTPNANFNGTDSFTYTVTDADSGESLTQTVTITVNPVNDDPVIVESPQTATVVEAGHEDDGITVVPGTPSAEGSFTATDVDSNVADQVWSVVGTPNAIYGSFSVDATTGEWTYTLNNSLPATQALNEGDEVPLTFTVQVADGNGGTAQQTVTITIQGTNDAPVANADVGTVKESGVQNGGNTPTAGTLTAIGDVLTNDTDVDDGETATLEVSGVSFGGTAGTLGSALAGTYGALVLNDDGSYTYTLDNTLPASQQLAQGASATEVFTYTIVDANGAESTSTLTITVQGTNDQPVITSNAAAAQGSVAEQGSANPGAAETTGGTLTASDVDTGATQAWTIQGSNNGTYGSISINAAGEWVYTLDNNLPATQALNDGQTGTETFTVRVTDEFGAWSEQTVTVTVNGSNDNVTGVDATVGLQEDPVGGAHTGTVQDYVADVDDEIQLVNFTIAGDTTVYTPGQTATIPGVGTVTIALDGGYVFTPLPNYSGAVPVVTYTVEEVTGGQQSTQTLTFEITPVSDAPDMDANKTLNVLEDNSIALGLTLPVITDTTDQNGVGTGDDPERLGAITLTIGGSGASGVTLSTGATVLTPVGGKLTIVITDEPHIAGVPAANAAAGVYHLTRAEYEALMANPVAESGRNFTVTVSAISHEVDSAGVIIPGVAGATSTQVVSVDVQAVTDGATLAISINQLTTQEDGTIDLSTHLTATQASSDANVGNDIDGSETYWYTVSGLPPGTVVNINGANYTANAAGTVTSTPSHTFTASPSITVKPPANYSGEISNITITLNSQDTDGDSNGTIGIVTSSVTLGLTVTPLAGDVAVDPVTTAEDTAVAFLSGVRVTDTDGSEVINSVSFAVPPGWVVTVPTAGAGWSLSGDGSAGNPYTITFTDGVLTEAQREAVLDAFTILPPAHSSVDVTIPLTIQTTDTATGLTSSVVTGSHNLTITVTPVAEQVGTDTNGADGNDVTINGNHTYTTPGLEDAWFALAQNTTDAQGTGNFDLQGPWSNEDADEFTYAVLTPVLSSGAAGETASGSVFRYYDGTAWHDVSYTEGSPAWIPMQYLNTLQFMPPPNVSGTFTITVQAGTVDYDDDAEVNFDLANPPTSSVPGVVNVALSGSAVLNTIEITPVADGATMALNGRASGMEDTDIALSIRTTSTDPSETFNVTITGIPVGATITYGTGAGAQTFTATAGNTSFTIPNFDNNAPLTVTPPPNSNVDFTLNVSAVSVDGGDTSAPTATRPILVSVGGVADEAVITPVATPPVYAEAVLDGSAHPGVSLGDLVTGVSSPDADGSETLTVRITGLPEGFTLTGATLVQEGNGTTGRVWTVSAADLANVMVHVPANYSGPVSLQMAGVTTENDGDSRTGAWTPVSFIVTPSPEATATDSAVLVEDQITLLNIAVVHANGDVDETLGRVFIAVDDVATSQYTLYLGATPLSAAGLTIQSINGVDYYVVPAAQVGQLGALGGAQLDANLGGFRYQYEVIDSAYGPTPAGSSVSQIKDGGTFDLSATPVTDPVTVAITGISGADSTSDAHAGDDATPDTAVVTVAGTVVTVNLNVASVDHDGSEQVVRVLIEGVPNGMTVNPPAGGEAHQLSGGSWMLVYPTGALPINSAAGITLPVEFFAGPDVAVGEYAITMTVQTQDRGQATSGEAQDSVTWYLDANIPGAGPNLPPTIDQWEYNDAAVTEDTPFVLSDVITAAVTVETGTVPNIFTVTLTDLPPGTEVAGMTRTVIGGVETWTASVVVPANANDATVEAALKGLLDSITVTPPPNSNENNAADGFHFNATLTASAQGGQSVSETIPDTVMVIPVDPVTDAAVITVTAADAGEDPVDGSVSVTINVSNPADGTHGTIVDGLLYVQVNATGGNAGGTVTHNGDELTLTLVDNVPGVPPGYYYVVDVGTTGGSVNLVYTPPAGTSPGDVVFNAWANTQETGAGNEATGSASDTATISRVNNGVEMALDTAPVTGLEPTDSDPASAIALPDLSVALVDPGETVHAVMLTGVPVGFLVYVDGVLAGNAGSDGSTNTWVLPSSNGTVGQVSILPPAHWSGELNGLALVVESGEASLPSRIDTIPLAPVTVTPVADGLTLETTQVVGREGQIVNLNLNAAMNDPVAASSTQADGSTETATVQFQGLGDYASFYVGGVLINAADAAHTATYDAASDTWTITGLMQGELDQLGFKQAASALTDQDAGTAGTQIQVTAWTVESDGGAESPHVTTDITVHLTAVSATSGADSFIWGGEGQPLINGRAGTDTVALRLGEDVDGADLALGLRNIEVLDLSANGANAVNDLTAADVLQISGTSHVLTINGTTDDSVTLTGNPGSWTAGTSSGGYIDYTSGSGASLVTVRVDEDIHISYV